MENGTRDLIDVYKDGDQWCAIYPMGSNLMECDAVAFSPIDIRFSEAAQRERNYGKYAVIQKIRTENPQLTGRFYCEYHD